jgi:hypothetical protein
LWRAFFEVRGLAARTLGRRLLLWRSVVFVMAGHSRSKNGIALLAYVPAIYALFVDSP